MRPPANMWKAVILIGGPDKGTRFRPLSLDVPKPLFPVAGLPMIQHHIEAFSKVQEIKEIFIIGFYSLTDDFKNFIEESKRNYSMRIQYLPEHTSLGTAGGLYHYRDQIEARSPTAFFVVNVDVCCKFPLKDILLFHQEKAQNGGITMVATEATHEESMSYGCVVKDPDTHEATHYVEKPETFVSSLINCGIYVFSADILRYLSDIFREHQQQKYEERFGNFPAEKISLEKEILIPYASSGKMFVYKITQTWGQIKSAASAIHANKLYLSDYHLTNPERLASNSPNGGPTIRGNVYIHPSSTVHSSAVLGPNVTIGKNVKVGPGVRVSNSILLPGSVVEDHCCILNSIIGWESTVGEWSRVEGTAQQPNPNAPFSKIISGALFNDDGRLIPSITVLGRGVSVVPEIIVLNTIVMPHKNIARNSKNQIIL